MSNYTTQLRTIIEMNSSKKRGGYSDIQAQITEARPKIFDFPYPIFDNNYKEPLERKILTHFYTREICEETVGLWKLRLADKMNEIMPYYNQLYESELLKFNPFHDIDYVMTHKGRANERKMQNAEQNTDADTDFTEGVDTTYGLDMVSDIIDNTHEVEGTVNKTVDDKDTDFVENKKLNEKVHTVTNVVDDKETNINEVEDKELIKDVTLNDHETTDYVEHVDEHSTQHKVGDNDTHLTDKGKDVDTTSIDETIVRTPNLKTDKQNDKTFDDLGTGADNRNIQRSEFTSTDEFNKGWEHTATTSDDKKESIDLFSDTPQGNLLRVDDGNGGEQGYDPSTGERQSLSRKLDTGWLTNARQIEETDYKIDDGTRDSTSDTTGHKKFDETTDDDVYHTRNYQQVTDDHTVTTDTGTETNKKDGLDVVTHDIDETHHTHYDIDETVTTDSTKDKTANTDFNKLQTENTKQTEHNTKETEKTEHETIDTVSDMERNQTEDNTYHKDENEVKDFTQTVDDNTDYTRNKVDRHDYASDKDTVSKKKFIESVTQELNHNIRNADEYINHAVGKISDMTYSKMLLEFRDTFLNIDEMILEELSDLFFMLY